MRRCLTLVALAALAALATPLAPADPVPAKKSPPAKADDWKSDPVCRMVFFAVLEGLYDDGVSTEAVDAVVGRKTKGGAGELKTTFVIECPLCHPVYEAFHAYQQRPAFAGGKRDSFGKGLEAKLESGLRSEYLITRQRALAVVVQRWVGRRLDLMRLSPEEKSEWSRRLQERSMQGKARLRELMAREPWYKGWSMYYGCAACNGTTDACRALRASGK
jgi:hypothetical protein